MWYDIKMWSFHFQAGFLLHSALHQARPDVKCIIHLHTPNIVAVSDLDDDGDKEEGDAGDDSFEEEGGDKTTPIRQMG